MTNWVRAGAPFLGAVLFLCSSAIFTQQSAKSSASPSTGFTRACSANLVLAPTAKKQGEHKPKHPLPPEPVPVCVEVKGEAIEVQEFLQAIAREQGWRIGENRESEDTWSFVRYFGADELDTYADTRVLLERVKFTSGKAAVTVRTTDIGEGYVRVQISSQFQGDGKSTDKISGQPGTVWPLNSRGVLEQNLLGALQSHYKPMA